VTGTKAIDLARQYGLTGPEAQVADANTDGHVSPDELQTLRAAGVIA